MDFVRYSSRPRTVHNFSDVGSGCFACFVGCDNTALETDTLSTCASFPIKVLGSSLGKILNAPEMTAS
jgi:hypothetical protein